ncbi:TetR/AcrR family transcriptional regulator [Azospirillum sp. A29]|uniref:TetR/AcrR family transcriptional regulator n=1 Tax=unclassified Azospirillum TaxID=2630922 RepID=UPI00366BBEC3
MARLSRLESMAKTRETLLKSAVELYLKFGFDPITVDQIAEHAGYSRGAFYAHFPSKDAIYLKIALDESAKVEKSLISIIRESNSRDDLIRNICEWTDRGIDKNEFSHLIVKTLYNAKSNSLLSNEDFSKLRSFWCQAGEALTRFFPDSRLPGTPEEIGATILLVLADGQFVERAGGPKTSRLLRLTLEAFLR